MPVSHLPLILMLCVVAVVPALAGQHSVQKPAVIAFGASLDDMNEALGPKCTSMDVRPIDPPQIPGATKQTQIDCMGFSYFGKPRKAEFVFADDSLSLVWILTQKAEEEALIAAFRKEFGEPSHDTPGFTAFADDHAAVRKDVPEALYYADHVAAAFQAWFDQQAAETQAEEAGN